ncbi:MAG: hypothetical protein WDO70_03740 [Alphaproteobacteria bacterium]
MTTDFGSPEVFNYPHPRAPRPGQEVADFVRGNLVDHPSLIVIADKVADFYQTRFRENFPTESVFWHPARTALGVKKDVGASWPSSKVAIAIAAALAHDIIEDSKGKITADMIGACWNDPAEGKILADALRIKTDDPRLKGDHRRAAQLCHIEEAASGVHGAEEASIYLALLPRDKFDNLASDWRALQEGCLPYKGMIRNDTEALNFIYKKMADREIVERVDGVSPLAPALMTEFHDTYRSLIGSLVASDPTTLAFASRELLERENQQSPGVRLFRRLAQQMRRDLKDIREDSGFLCFPSREAALGYVLDTVIVEHVASSLPGVDLAAQVRFQSTYRALADELVVAGTPKDIAGTPTDNPSLIVGPDDPRTRSGLFTRSMISAVVPTASNG